jgi:hypothetical protein
MQWHNGTSIEHAGATCTAGVQRVVTGDDSTQKANRTVFRLLRLDSEK